MNLLFSIDQNCSTLLLNCMNSISKNGGAEQYDAYILHSDLHIDLQIHISPDSTAEQIETIFASMAKHLYGANN